MTKKDLTADDRENLKILMVQDEWKIVHKYLNIVLKDLGAQVLSHPLDSSNLDELGHKLSRVHGARELIQALSTLERNLMKEK